MKKSLLILCLLVSLFVVSGCEKKELNNKSKNEVMEDSNSKIETPYLGNDELVRIPMGVSYNKNQIVLCEVKIPKNYSIDSIYYYPNDAVDLDNMRYPDGKRIEGYIGNNIEAGAFSNGIYPGYVWFNYKENSAFESFFLEIRSSQLESGENYIDKLLEVEHMKNELLDATENRFVYGTDGDNLYFTYELNDKYILSINYMFGNLKKKNIKDVARTFYNQIIVSESSNLLNEEKIDAWIMNDFKFYPYLKDESELFEIPMGNENGKLATFMAHRDYVDKLNSYNTIWIEDETTREELIEIVKKEGLIAHIGGPYTEISITASTLKSWNINNLEEYAKKCITATKDNGAKLEYIRSEYAKIDGIEYVILQENGYEQDRETTFIISKDGVNMIKIEWELSVDNHVYIVNDTIENIAKELSKYIKFQ